ncbi:hypothetical protein, partial [Actinomadura sp. CNU-125]|uniref:hypothetical protein n=1 Tax=Actinomadura sp. CNU-125 TaxID=1904961 RepID=UPI001300FAEE
SRGRPSSPARRRRRPRRRRPPSGAVPFGRESEPPRGPGQSEGGEWTRMYGEDDLRRDGR